MRHPLWFLSSAMAVCAGLSSHAAVSAHGATQAADARARGADASADTAALQRRPANVQAAPQATPRPTPRPAPPPTRAPARQPVTSDSRVPERSRTERPVPPAPPRPATATSRADRSRPVQPVQEAQWMRRVASAYPSRALANEIEGTVGVLLTVTTAGRVGACSVTQSSGAAVLDEAACTAFTRYAVFEPALAWDGQPIAGRWRSQVSYRLPSSTAAMTPPTPTAPPTPTPTAPPTPTPRPTPTRPDRSREVEPIDEAQWMRRVAASYPSRAIANEIEGTVVVVLTVNSVGRVAFCKVTQSSGADVLDEAACSGFRRYAVFEPALRSDGKPVAGRWRTQVSYRLQ